MTEEVKQEVKRKPRTKVAPSPVETPPIESTVESHSAPTVAKEVPPPAPRDLANFKGSFTTNRGSVVTYL